MRFFPQIYFLCYKYKKMSFKDSVAKVKSSLEAKGNEIMPLTLWFSIRYTHESLDVAQEDEITVCDEIVASTKDVVSSFVGIIDELSVGIEHFTSKEKTCENEYKYCGDRCKRHLHIHGKIKPNAVNMDILDIFSNNSNIDDFNKVMTKKINCKIYNCVKANHKGLNWSLRNTKHIKWDFDVDEGNKLLRYPLKMLDHMNEVTPSIYDGFSKKWWSCETDFLTMRTIATTWYNENRAKSQKKKAQLMEEVKRPFWSKCEEFIQTKGDVRTLSDYNIVFHIIEFHKLEKKEIHPKDIQGKFRLWKCLWRDGYDVTLANEILDGI